MKLVTDPEFGAVPDGPDCTIPFQRALDWSSKNAQPVLVPTALFRFYDPRGLVMDHNAALVGEGAGRVVDPMFAPWEKLAGPTLLVHARTAEQGRPFITGIQSNVALDQLIIAYPDQIRQTQPGAPSPYPPTLVMKGTGHLSRLYIPNAWEAVKIYCGRVDMEWCHIQGLKQDLEIDGSWDVNYISHCRFHAWCGWGMLPFNTPLFWWCENNSMGLRLVKADGLIMDDVLIFGRHTAITFDEDPNVEQWSTSGKAVDINIDTCRNGVIARGLNPRVGFNFTNLQLGPYWGAPVGVAMQTFPSVKNNPKITVRGGSIRKATGNGPTQPPEDWRIVQGLGTRIDIDGMLGHGRLGPQP